MSIFDGQAAATGVGNTPFSGAPRTGVPVAELPENQYRRIVEAQERNILAQYGNGAPLSEDEPVQAQAAVDRLQALRQARAAFLAQQSAQESIEVAATGSASAEPDDPGQAAIDAFRKIMSMTPEERLFELLLKKRGLTKEEFEALPPEEREKIFAEITEEIREKIEKKSASTGTPSAPNTDAAATSPTVQASGQPVAGPRIDASGAAATVTQRDIVQLAEQRSPNGKVGFEDLLIVATQGRETLSKLTGKPETPPHDDEKVE